jgi:anti-sigma regulatory factor (Ser/Thr protein kinase)
VCWSESESYPAGPSTPAAARRFTVTCLGQLLGDDQSVIADAALATSELVTNAVNARATKVTVEVMVHHDYLRLAVSDDAGGQPELRTTGPNSTGGRGLHIVEQLARRWGSLIQSDGKQVWAELPLDPAAPTSLVCTI